MGLSARDHSPTRTPPATHTHGSARRPQGQPPSHTPIYLESGPPAGFPWLPWQRPQRRPQAQGSRRGSGASVLPGPRTLPPSESWAAAEVAQDDRRGIGLFQPQWARGWQGHAHLQTLSGQQTPAPVCPFVHLSVRASIHPPTCPSFRLPTRPPSTRLSSHQHLPACPAGVPPSPGATRTGAPRQPRPHVRRAACTWGPRLSGDRSRRVRNRRQRGAAPPP